MTHLPDEYLFVDKEGNTFYKQYRESKKERPVTPYMLASTPVVFDKEATAETLFKLVEKNTHLKPILFAADDFIKESKKENTSDIAGQLHFYWWEFEVDSKYGMTRYPKMEVDGIDEKGEAFGIEFLSVEKLKNLKISIDNNLKVIDEHGKTLYTFTAYPTLFQVLYGFFWEISFFGDPEDREEKSAEIQESLKSVIKDIENKE